MKDLSFAARIENWYKQNGRDLPWRHTRDAYRIWLSEVILQQTRVEQGRDYWHRFIERFPTVEHLALAEEDEVMRLWQGLGYYSRARNLHRAAKQIAEKGQFPRTYDELITLPGVGKYTAAAIASFAYDEAHAVLDGNVYRVLARYEANTTPIDTPAGMREFSAIAQMHLDEHNPALYNQAIMDFGAMVCKPQAPLCTQCPLSDTCMALFIHQVDKLPIKQHNIKLTERYLTFVCIRRKSDERFLMQKRHKGDIYRGLYQFPVIESLKSLTPVEVERQMPPGSLTLLEAGVSHRLTHRMLHMDFYECLTDTPFHEPKGIWMSADEVDACALPRPLEAIWKKIRSR